MSDFADYLQPEPLPSQPNPSLAPLERDYGTPFIRNAHGKVTQLNERFWAGFYASEHKTLFEPAQQTFYSYDPSSGIWSTITADLIREQLAAKLHQLADDPSILKHIKSSVLSGIVTSLRGIVEQRDPFTHKPPIIHVKNGIVEFTTGSPTLKPFCHSHFSRNASQFAWDPTATCPRFINELLRPALSEDDILLLQKLMGMFLHGLNILQRFLILDGTAGAGKSTIIRIIQALIGILNTYQLRLEVIQERFETARYIGKSLLIGSDVPGNFLSGPGAPTLKSLIGGDPLAAECKGSNADITLFGNFNVLMTSNCRLRCRLEDDAAAWLRRVTIIRFSNPPPTKRIQDFHAVLLREEGPGILNWCIEGFRLLLLDTAETGDVNLSPDQRTRVSSLINESNSIQVFVSECLEEAPDCSITTDELVAAYAEFCANRGWSPVSERTFAGLSPDAILDTFHLSRSNSILRDGKNTRGWRHLRVTPGAVG